RGGGPGVVLAPTREAHHRGQRAAQLIEHVHGALLTFPELLDQHDALLQLRLLLFELLHLLDDAVQPRGLCLLLGNLPIEVGRIARERPVAPAADAAREDKNQSAGQGDFLSRLERRLLFLRFAFDGEEVDANHRSPAVRSARPTATAVAVVTRSASVTPSFAGSNAIFWNGLN